MMSDGAKERVPESVTRVASEGVFSFTLLINSSPGPVAVMTRNDTTKQQDTKRA